MSVALAAERLQSLDLFRGLGPGEIQELLAVADDLTYAEGQIVFEAGQQQRALFVILEGKVEIDLQVPKLGERMVAEVGEGSIFGEMSFFHESPHSATVKCLTPARIIRLLRSQFDTLAEQNRTAALRLGANAAEILAARLQHTDHWIVDTLAGEREHQIRENWRKLRSSLTHTFSHPRPMIGPGAGW